MIQLYSHVKNIGRTVASVLSQSAYAKGAISGKALASGADFILDDGLQNKDLRAEGVALASFRRGGSGGRYAASMIIGAGVTLVLGVIMARLIAAEFTPQDKIAGLDYAVAVEIVDLPPPLARERPKLLDAVDVPPSTPRISTQTPDAVKLAPVPIAATPIDWKPTRLDPSMLSLQPADRNEQPIIRNPPTMPMRADRSGHCIMAFDVTAEGTPFNVKAVSCSQSLFARASERAVSRWRYNPKIVDGQPVARQGMRNQITFNLVDERGNLIPE